MNIKFQLLPDSEQYFILGRSKKSALSNVEALSFIVQSTPENYNFKLNTQQKEALCLSMSKNLKKGTIGYYFSVPDRIYYIQSKK